MAEERPWGKFEVILEERDYKVKRITVWGAKRISLQYHKQRSEHWHIVSGSGIVTIGNNSLEMSRGESVDIPRGAVHRIHNTGSEDLILIEIQRGEYMGEDDIFRLEDDFGRIPDKAD